MSTLRLVIRKTRIFQTLCAAACLLLAGCSKDNPALGDGGPADSGWLDSTASAKTCASDKDCTSLGLVCDPLNKKCAQCLFDTDCEDGQHCSKLFCVPFTNCKNSLDCVNVKGKPICSKSLAECVACDTAADCGENAECKAYACVPYTPCTSSKECAAQVCDRPAGKCVDCLTAADCGDGKECVDSTCVTKYVCQSDKECTPYGMLCDKPAGVCRECLQHSDCPSAYNCSSHKCVLDSCAQGQSRCQGNSVVTCNSVGDAYGSPLPCGALFCVLAGTKASCKSAADPDAGAPPDLGPVPESGVRPDRSVKPDSTPAGCNPPGHATMAVNRLTAGDLSLALDPAFAYKALSISGAQAKQALATLDYNKGVDQVAGFALSQPTSAATVSAAVTQAISGVQRDVYGTVTATSNGAAVTSHDSFPSVVLTTLTVKLPSVLGASLLRDKVAAAILGVATTAVTGWPTSYGTASTDFVVQFATVLRSDGRFVCVGAVTEDSAYASAATNARMLSGDLADGSAVARASATATTTCDSLKASMSTNNKVDIIWVVDESGSMSDDRARIANSANTFFQAATSAGLDFRMGVTNVCSPTGSYQTLIGKFCSSISSNTADTGGTDRFLLPSEQAIFSSCINNPPGYEGGSEYPLTNAQKAIERHLPRAANDPAKIRTGAQLVIIVVTDEMDNGIQSFGPSSCTLSAADAARLDTYIQPYRTYFSGTTNSETKVDFFQALAGVCGNSCSAYVGHDMESLAKTFKGAVYDVCQTNLAASITKIINDIKVGSFTSPLKPTRRPVTGSLRVALDGTTLLRGTGFSIDTATNTLSINSAAIKNGSIITAAYTRW